MTDGTNLDERLAQLAARRASASSPQDAAPRVAPKARRAHPAAAARVFAAGLTTSSFLAIVTALGAQQPASATKAASARPRGPVTQPFGTTSLPPTTKPKVVEKTVHHVVYVDKYGRPVSPSLVAMAGAITSTGAANGSGGRTYSSGAGATHYVSAPSGGSGATPAVVPSNPTTPSNPTQKPPTTSPSPAPTSPPVTVQTPPPPPPAPPCTGSKCP